MRIHKEGVSYIWTFGILLILTIIWMIVAKSIWITPLILIALFFFIFSLNFFRNPERKIPVSDPSFIYAPADGRVVVIEEAQESEYFKDKRIQVSIFMSPLNVHANRMPIGGEISYSKYHEGKYLVAWHPKSSTENERSTVVVSNHKAEILMRQIAGAVARRIKTYVAQGDQMNQGDEMGFIKFGSRVDLFLPLDTEIQVSLEQHVEGNTTVIGKLP